MLRGAGEPRTDAPRGVAVDSSDEAVDQLRNECLYLIDIIIYMKLHFKFRTNFCHNRIYKPEHFVIVKILVIWLAKKIMPVKVKSTHEAVDMSLTMMMLNHVQMVLVSKLILLYF